MTELKNDKELEQRFEQLRSGNRVSLRSIEALLASKSWRVPKRPRSLRLAIAMLLILLVVVVTVVSRLAFEGRARSPAHVDGKSATWSAPTDFLLATQGVVARQSANRALRENLFPPELVLANDQRLALKTEQRAAIAQDVQQLQNKLAELQSRVPDEGTRLAEILQRSRIGENEALTQLDQVLAVERELKRAQLAMLVRVKNVLTPEQQAVLNRMQ